MRLRSHCQHVAIDTSSADDRACLVFVEDRLVTVLVQISEAEHVEPELWGRWFVEAGFGPCSVAPSATVTFETREEAQAWARARVGASGRGPAAERQ